MEPMLLLVVVFAVMMIPMLLMSNRQRKLQRAQQEMVARLGIGDEVRTHSGFYGLIIEEYDEFVILESEGGAQTKWARAAISTRVDADGKPVAAGAQPPAEEEPESEIRESEDVSVLDETSALEDPAARSASTATETSAVRSDEDFLGGTRPENRA